MKSVPNLVTPRNDQYLARILLLQPGGESNAEPQPGAKK
jgi:hypothetical protein